MTALDIFNEISDRQIVGLMFHNQMADYFDFLGLNGFKRMHEYHYFKESAEMRGVHRYMLNHINKLPRTSNTTDPKAIPSNWSNYTRLEVDENTRKSAVKDALMKYRDWECETLSFYEKKFKELSDLGCIAYTNKVMDLIKDVDEELKRITRIILKYKAVDWNMVLIEEDQDELHECYKKKTKEIGIDIC